jgi:hypothetical protein
VLVAVERDGFPVVLQVRDGRSEVVEGRLGLDEAQLHEPRQSRCTWRSETPRSSPAFAQVRRRSRIRCTSSRRSISRTLIVISSGIGSPPDASVTPGDDISSMRRPPVIKGSSWVAIPGPATLPFALGSADTVHAGVRQPVEGRCNLLDESRTSSRRAAGSSASPRGRRRLAHVG